ncbi:MAG: DUF559 domain-containing protein [Candidatus Binatia bacterium]
MLPPFKKPSKQVSERMRRVRSRGTRLEKSMERVLWGLGYDYEKQPDVRGHPDFRIKATNVLIFCDSSFWHGRRRKELSGVAFGRNREFWTKKLRENKRRDERTTRALRREGWSVQRFWDTDILKRPDKVKARLQRVVGNAKR